MFEPDRTENMVPSEGKKGVRDERTCFNGGEQVIVLCSEQIDEDFLNLEENVTLMIALHGHVDLSRDALA